MAINQMLKKDLKLRIAPIAVKIVEERNHCNEKRETNVEVGNLLMLLIRQKICDKRHRIRPTFFPIILSVTLQPFRFSNWQKYLL